MDKFWKWMEEQEHVTYYAAKAGHDVYFTDFDYWTNEKDIDKQMLIGYMIEYLMYNLLSLYPMRNCMNIEDVYNMLVAKVKGIE